MAGALMMGSRLNADINDFHQSKKWGIAGLLLGLGLWFFGFQVIGGEWFAMWQSETWNALDAAFRVTAFILGTLIFVAMKND
jgi:predicted small integral membrane protein